MTIPISILLLKNKFVYVLLFIFRFSTFVYKYQIYHIQELQRKLMTCT